MNNNFNNLAFRFILLSFLVLSGCVSPKTYVDPTFSEASYSDINSVSNKYVVSLEVEFQTNGETVEKVNKELKNYVMRSLLATGVFSPDDQSSSISLKVVVNNISDTATAVAKGIGTGLTWGIVGSVVTDYYEVIISYSDGKGENISELYQHAIHTTIGIKEAPFENMQPTSLPDAFMTVIDQVILNFVKDMQTRGLLSRIVLPTKLA